MRLLYLYTCFLMLASTAPCGCSRQFFKAHALHEHMLDLAMDHVPNVRLKLVAMLPRLKRALRLPADAAALEKLHHAVVSLQADTAPDVRAAAVAAEQELHSVEVLTEGAPRRSLLAIGGAAQAWIVAEEEEDAARLREEEVLLCAEQDAAAE